MAQTFTGRNEDVAVGADKLAADLTELYAGTGASTVTPVTLESPPTSAQALINAAAIGATVTLGPYAYREYINVNKSITLVGVPGTKIKCSDVWTGWTKTGNTWVSTLAVPTLTQHASVPATGMCTIGEGCYWMEQAYIDGYPQKQVAVGVTPLAGEFAINASRNIILGSDPTGKTVEVSVRQRSLFYNANNVTVRGCTFTHGATSGQDGMIGSNSVTGIVFEDNDVSWSHGPGLNFYLSTGIVRRNRFHHNGQTGTLASYGDVEFIDNEVDENNVEGYSPYWAAGGIKVAVMNRTVFRNNHTHHNAGEGLWLDIDCKLTTIEDNRVHHNSGQGIHYEVSGTATDRAEIRRNVCWSNGGAGIQSASCFGTKIHNNIVAWNRRGINALSQNRTDYPAFNSPTNIEVYDNDIIQKADPHDPDGSFAVAWWGWQASFYSEPTNIGYDNRYYFGTPESIHIARFQHTSNFTSLASFNATTGEERGRYLTEAEKDRILAHYFLGEVPGWGDLLYHALNANAEVLPVPSNGQTVLAVDPKAGRTGLILEAGSRDGQELAVLNVSTVTGATMTFNATPATSRILDTSGYALPISRAVMFRWKTHLARWVRF